MDYFNDVLPMFLDFDCGGMLAVYGRVRELSEFIQNILICVLKMNEWWKSYRLFFRQKRSIVCCQKCSDVTFKSSSFLFLANACDQHEDVRNLCSKIFCPDLKFLIVLIPIEMTFSPENLEHQKWLHIIEVLGLEKYFCVCFSASC